MLKPPLDFILIVSEHENTENGIFDGETTRRGAIAVTGKECSGCEFRNGALQAWVP